MTVKVFLRGTIAATLFLCLVATDWSYSRDLAIKQKSGNQHDFLFDALILPPLLLGVWIDWTGFPDILAGNAALQKELDQGDVVVDEAGSLEAMRLCMNDELGYSYTLRAKKHVGICPSAINMTAEISAMARLLDYEKFTGAPHSEVDSLAADWWQAVSQSVLAASRDAVTGGYTKRCTGVYRYFLWRTEHLMPSLCEQFHDQERVQSYVTWRENLVTRPPDEESHYLMSLHRQMKNISLDRKVAIAFLLLHEIGHHRLQHHASVRQTPEQEIEADKFAFRHLSIREKVAVSHCIMYMIAMNPRSELPRKRMRSMVESILSAFSLESLSRLSVQERRRLMLEIEAPETDGDEPNLARLRITESFERLLVSLNRYP